MNEEFAIQRRDYWFKVFEMLQQNWTLIESNVAGVVVYFFGDTSRVFDEMRFPSHDAAMSAFQMNGFRRITDDANASSFLRCPKPPFNHRPHPNCPIYSSGRFWKTLAKL